MTGPAPAPPSAAPARAGRGTWRLLGADRRSYDSHTPGALGGHRRNRIYGRLDCPTAPRALARGSYRSQRVFFADEPTAVNAGYRPCAVCLPTAYRAWQTARSASDPQTPAPGN
jgi:methylphosphotriester-DNA--protein-cysteine methyltransferase